MDGYQNENINLNNFEDDSSLRKRQKTEHLTNNKSSIYHSTQLEYPKYQMSLDVLNVDGGSSSVNLSDSCSGTPGAPDEQTNRETTVYNVNSVQSTSDDNGRRLDIYTDRQQEIQQVPEGRPIVNTSLMKFATQNQQQQQMKSRAPLSSVQNNRNNNVGKCGESSMKKPMNLAAEQEFFLFKMKSPFVVDEDYFSKLSDEMILSVFKWLPKKTLMRCSHVCRRFSIVAQDESLWSRLDLAGRHIRSGALGRILSRGVIILRLAQTKIHDPIFDSNEICVDYMSKVQYLDLSMAVISKVELFALFSRCRQLKKLSLEHVPIDTDICTQLAANRNMEALNLTMCEGIDVDGVQILMTGLKSLQSLNISWTSLNGEAVKMFVETVPCNLTRLNIAGCRKSMSDLYLNQLVKRCPALIELDLSDCGALTAEALKIVSKLQILEYLSVSRCYNISLAAYLSINELLPSLAYLDIFGVMTDHALKLLQESYPSVGINQFIHSAVARPTVGSRRTSIWGLRTRD